MTETVDVATKFEVQVAGGQVVLLLHAETGNTVSISMDRKAASLLADKLRAAAQRAN